MSADISIAISALDDNPLSNEARISFARTLLSFLPTIDSVESVALSINNSKLNRYQRIAFEEIWRRVKFESDNKLNCRARIVAATFASEQKLDGHDAEFIVGCAEEIGLSDQEIERALNSSFEKFGGAD
jgi:hypothetical protein